VCLPAPNEWSSYTVHGRHVGQLITKLFMNLLIRGRKDSLCVLISVNSFWHFHRLICRHITQCQVVYKTRKLSCRWQTRATRKHAKNCSNMTCLQCCRWQYWSVFIRLAVVASEICEIPRNSLKIQTHRVQGHPRLSILVSIESAYATSY